MSTLKDIGIDDLNDPEVNKEGTVVLPQELEEAPKDIQEAYVRWVEFGISSKNNPRRYFTFINQETKELEQIDAMSPNGVAVKRSKQKNISLQDLKMLRDLCDEMEDLKVQKSRLKRKWLKWVRPRMGRDVFDWRKAQIIDMFAKYAHFDEVKKNLEEMGYVVQIDHVYKFFLNNKDVIDKKRTEFIRSARDHYLATDAGRMETLAMLHSRFMELFNTAYNSISPNKAELRALSQEIRAIIEQARKEIKGEEVKLTIDGKIDINASIQAAATIQDISKRIPINIIPIYLVAVKQGINPNQILASLVSSFYKDFNGFNRLNTKGQVPTTMDIIRNYDWNEINRFHEQKKEEVIETVEYEEMAFAEVQKVQTKREKLLELINSQLADKPGESK
jgi:hypothetical protein